MLARYIVLRTTTEVDRNVRNLTPAVPTTPEPMVTKFSMGGEVVDPYPQGSYGQGKSEF